MAKVIYNLIILFTYIPYIFVIFLRKIFKKEHSFKFKEKLFFNNRDRKRPNGYLFWFHVASLGEFNSILPIIDYYIKKDKKYCFLITSVTLSSYMQFQKKFENNDRVFHQFLPYDINLLIKNFLNNWRPDIISFVDSEIWPNFIFEIKKRKIPLILLNARITKKTFRRWLFFKNFAYSIFSCFSSGIASSKESLEYLRLLNTSNLKYFGNIKFCTPINKSKGIHENQFGLIKNKKVWVALSTHHDEEIFCLSVHRLMEKYEKNIVTIIIPRHINRIKKIFNNLSSNNVKVQIKNENDLILQDSNIVLVNYYGLTAKYLDRYKFIFIGKSLVPSLSSVGGQNPIEAIKNSCKVYHGPFVYNFKEIYNYLDEKNFAEKLSENRTQAAENLSKKLLEDFKKDTQIDNKKIEEVDNYSKKIFNDVIEEYNSFIK